MEKKSDGRHLRRVKIVFDNEKNRFKLDVFVYNMGMRRHGFCCFAARKVGFDRLSTLSLSRALCLQVGFG